MSHIFISYSKKNRAQARRLADELLRRGYDVWIDDRIDYGQSWERVIFQAIQDCGAFVVLMTPESYDSDWVLREIQYADRRSKPQFPILIAGEIFPRYGPTQVVDLSDGRLPPEDFYEDLNQHISPKPSYGVESPSEQQPAQSVTTVVSPSTLKKDATIERARRRSIWTMGLVGVMLLLSIGVAAFVLNNQSRIVATATAREPASSTTPSQQAIVQLPTDTPSPTPTSTVTLTPTPSDTPTVTHTSTATLTLAPLTYRIEGLSVGETLLTTERRNITVALGEGLTINSVEFRLNEQSLGRLSQPPYQITLDGLALQPGTYILVVTVQRDGSERIESIPFSVVEPTATPTLTFTLPPTATMTSSYTPSPTTTAVPPSPTHTPIPLTLTPSHTATTNSTPTHTSTPSPTPTPTRPASTTGTEFPSIVQLLENDGSFSQFLAGVDQCNLVPRLESLQEEFTLFAPTDSSLEAYTSLDNSSSSYCEFVGNHIVSGQHTLRNLTPTTSLNSLTGQSLVVRLEDGVLTVNDVEVGAVDRLASNGVVHILYDSPIVFTITAISTPTSTTTTAQFIVNRNNVNIRTGPGTSYPVLTTASSGDVFTVTGRAGRSGDEWYQINVRFYGIPGWISDQVGSVNVSLGQIPIVSTPAPPVVISTATPTTASISLSTAPSITNIVQQGTNCSGHALDITWNDPDGDASAIIMYSPRSNASGNEVGRRTISGSGRTTNWSGWTCPSGRCSSDIVVVDRAGNRSNIWYMQITCTPGT
jgi:uncharacterized surface protein with fasciclin (FAS1) repeats/uncharacterized protein YraI